MTALVTICAQGDDLSGGISNYCVSPLIENAAGEAVIIVVLASGAVDTIIFSTTNVLMLLVLNDNHWHCRSRGDAPRLVRGR